MPNIVSMKDAAHPAKDVKSDIVAGYIGGAATHIWTPAEWGMFKGVKKLPIYVAPEAIGRADNAKDDAWDCLHALYALRVPGQPVVIDMETKVDPDYVNGFADVVEHFGYLVWVYGSKDFVFHNPARHGYWVADYTGVPHMVDHLDVRATQYKPGPDYDLSEVKLWQWVHRVKWA